MAGKKRINGEGSITYENAREKYRAAITDPNGKRIVKRFDSHSDADKWLSNIKSEIFKNQYISPSDITLGEWILDWLQTYVQPNVREKTYIIYKGTAKHIAPLASYKLQSLSATIVQRYLNELPETMSQNCKHKIFTLLAASIKKAYQLEMLSKNFMDILTKPKLKQKHIEIFTRNEITNILTFLKNSETNLRIRRYYPFILLAVSTGARLGELLGLHWNDIDFENNEIYIQRTLEYIKGKKMIESPPKTDAGKRKVKIPISVSKVLNDLRAKQTLRSIDNSDYVFRTRNNTPINSRNMLRAWSIILRDTNVNYKNFHVLRHTHATELLASGMPIIEVSRRLGHSKASITLDMYGQFLENFDSKLADAIADIYALNS